MKNFLNTICRYILSEESIQEANHRFHHNKNSASRRNKENNLPFWFVCLMTKQKYCFYSGEEFGTGTDRMSFERINPDIGYIVGNVVPVKIKYNCLRSNADAPEDLLPRIQTNQKTANRLAEQLDAMKSLVDTISTRLDVIMTVPAAGCSSKAYKNYPIEIKSKTEKRERIKKSIESVTRSYNEAQTAVNDLLNLQQMIARFHQYRKPTLAMKFAVGML